jgi:hypothetical protein
MGFPDLSTTRWRKSSHSNGDGGECVEVADGFPGIVPVRDSKDITRGAIVAPAASWADMVTALKSR